MEERWKAGHFMNLKAHAPFFERRSMHGLRTSSWQTVTGSGAQSGIFELASVSRELIEKFSKRTLEIERLCKAKYTVLKARARKVRETGMDFADASVQVKAALGAESPQSKATIKLTEEEQVANWRSQLTPQERKSLERSSTFFARLEKLNLTKAQREDAINHLPGDVVEFHRRAAGGFKSGEQWQVIGSQGRKEIVVERNGERRFLPLAHAGKFTLFRAESFALSVGDTVRITKNYVWTFATAFYWQSGRSNWNNVIDQKIFEYRLDTTGQSDPLCWE